MPDAPRAFLFDIGNVIFTFDYGRASRKMSEKCSLSEPEIRAELDHHVPLMEDGRLSREDFIDQICEKIAYTGSADEFVQAYVDIFRPNEPVWALIEQLSPHYPLYHLSNISALHLDYLRKTYPIFSHFAGGAYSFQSRCAKPHDGIYHEATALCGCAPAQIIYLDDLVPNVATGQRHGWRTWQYDPTDHARFLAWLRDQGVAVSV